MVEGEDWLWNWWLYCISNDNLYSKRTSSASCWRKCISYGDNDFLRRFLRLVCSIIISNSGSSFDDSWHLVLFFQLIDFCSFSFDLRSLFWKFRTKSGDFPLSFSSSSFFFVSFFNWFHNRTGNFSFIAFKHALQSKLENDVVSIFSQLFQLHQESPRLFRRF